MSFFLCLFHYPLTHLLFIWAQIDGGGDGVDTSFRLLLLTDWCMSVRLSVLVCNLTVIVVCVYAAAFLHACMWKNKWVIRLHQRCLPSHNKCTQIFGTLWHQPPTVTHTYTHSSSQCDELSVPVRLGILVSTRFGSPFRGVELRTFSSQHSRKQRTRSKEDRQEVRAKDLSWYRRVCI